MNKANLLQMIDQGYISVQKHPEYDLFIYNYTQKTQYDQMWNDETLQCRGLIIDKNDVVKARPLLKFFNLEQFEGTLPSGNFKVYDKMDGSLGILYWVGGKPFIATRGSFNSEQAVVGTVLLRNYSEYISSFNQSYTYLFEIIYPNNRIVVDYGKSERLCLLAVIETATGLEIDIDMVDFPDKAKRFDGIVDITEIEELQNSQDEGFVISWDNGLRLKFKFSEYKRLHKILTNVSAKIIWEYLMDAKELDEIIDKVPDEFFNWVKETETKILSDYNLIELETMASFKNLGDRRATAEYFKTQKYPSIFFLKLDNRDYSSHIWKIIKPKFETPFKQSEN